ncbi:MAG: hypothetical protein AAGE61_20800, partial [Pseudomonadota bacterium]
PDQDTRIPINRYCPWSGKRISQDATLQYRGLRVGFCSTAHRDEFGKALDCFDAACRQSAECDKSAWVLRNVMLGC